MDSTTPISEEILDKTILKASSILKSHQTDDGHWAFELEADVCISAEYIMLNHYLDEIDDDVESKIANYLRAKQGDHGGWPLFLDGNMDLSSSVKAYYALKLAGDNENAPHMVHARKAILDAGGAVNV
ncbi:MAG: prenyltransferase/squalene oxidase repeat-containing protein, partial [Rhodospirillales bacterium]|nr:prenyltransferase/squalene oxidase repeat-containing protein [Rhodospirillales bacterium]